MLLLAASFRCASRSLWLPRLWLLATIWVLRCFPPHCCDLEGVSDMKGTHICAYTHLGHGFFDGCAGMCLLPLFHMSLYEEVVCTWCALWFVLLVCDKVSTTKRKYKGTTNQPWRSWCWRVLLQPLWLILYDDEYMFKLKDALN